MKKIADAAKAIVAMFTVWFISKLLFQPADYVDFWETLSIIPRAIFYLHLSCVLALCLLAIRTIYEEISLKK